MLQSAAIESAGKIVFQGELFSPAFNANRMVRIYLPPSYDREPKRRYPVLYVHDGQNAFTTAGPHAAFGWGNWELDRAVDKLVNEKRMSEIIMVAVDCSRERYREYRGPAGSTNANGDRLYEQYKQFLINELKPKIDREYRTLRAARNTGVLGSSMGGICSVALAWDSPDVFGKAASLSGAFQVEQRYFLRKILGAPNAKKKPVKIYLDSGVVDFSGGDDGAKNTAAVATELERVGWRKNKDLLHYVDASPMTPEQLALLNLAADKFKEAQRSQHNELYWRLRVWRPLTYLFPP